jgi:hypothetical protein
MGYKRDPERTARWKTHRQGPGQPVRRSATPSWRLLVCTGSNPLKSRTGSNLVDMGLEQGRTDQVNCRR